MCSGPGSCDTTRRSRRWPDRDRFVLSNGHASILLYSLLYLTGYDLSLDDIRQFRQWGSRTPGHPEYRHTAGVEVTTGPLGQGFGNAVGMAIAERFLRARFGRDVCDHRTFVFAGDGCFMEGISHEAASLAGHLGLGKLLAFYDDNHITIDGPTELAYSDNVPERFEAYGWHVRNLGEMANDVDGLEAAIREAMTQPTDGPEAKPTLLVLRSHIGWPSPKLTDTATAHGSPFGADEIKVTKGLLGLPPDESFWIPDEVLRLLRPGGGPRRGQPDRMAGPFRRLDRRPAVLGGRPGGARRARAGRTSLPTFEAGTKLATRRAINQCLNATAPGLPGLLAGSADLTGNNGVALKGADLQAAATPGGAQLHYGIREHAMGATMNGMALHGGVLPVGGTFFIFSDYMRPAVRLAALSGAHVIYSWTHDSIGVGEDGPTHEPVEHLASLRAMPQMIRRPSGRRQRDGAGLAAGRRRPRADRPGAHPPGPCPVLDATAERAPGGVEKGGYVLVDESGAGQPPQLVLIGTGSEVQHCVGAAKELEGSGVSVRVVSLPCWEWFEQQGEEYVAGILPPGVPTLSVEAGATFGWSRYADASVGLDRFGASAPGGVNMEKFGFTVDHVVERARALLATRSSRSAVHPRNSSHPGSRTQEKEHEA